MGLRWCRQGCYAAGDVTILTPYTGQLLILASELAACREMFSVPSLPEAAAQQPRAEGSRQGSHEANARTGHLAELVPC